MIKIKAVPKFEGDSGEYDDGYVWTYDVEVENMSDKPIQILARNWKIVDSNCNVREVVGEGVIGKKPIIKSGEKFQYSSFAQLNCSSGIMYGSYQVKKVGSEKPFTVDIPAFSLDIPNNDKILN